MEEENSLDTELCNLPTKLLEKVDSHLTAVLTVISGSQLGAEYQINTDSDLIIGSSPDCAIHITDKGVSKKHARVFCVNDKLFIEDLNSTNGVIIKGKRISELNEIKEGDRLCLGAITVIKFTMNSALDLEYKESIYDKVSIDSLSRAYNKGFFDRQFKREFERSLRSSLPLSLLMIDIDHFKKINDRWGHPGGDEVIKQTARILKKYCRNVDYVCRYGGEEFAIICPNLNKEGSCHLAESIRFKISNYPYTYDLRTLSVTISIGIASNSNTEFYSTNDFIKAADKALYWAKENGRNNYKAYQF